MPSADDLALAPLMSNSQMFVRPNLHPAPELPPGMDTAALGLLPVQPGMPPCHVLPYLSWLKFRLVHALPYQGSHAWCRGIAGQKRSSGSECPVTFQLGLSF